jgi:hypothetical protein
VIRRHGRVYIQYWLYYADSKTVVLGSDKAWEAVWLLPRLAGIVDRAPTYPGMHRDDWESFQVRLDPDGEVWVRSSSHGHSRAASGPTAATVLKASSPPANGSSKRPGPAAPAGARTPAAPEPAAPAQPARAGPARQAPADGHSCGPGSTPASARRTTYAITLILTTDTSEREAEAFAAELAAGAHLKLRRSSSEGHVIAWAETTPAVVLRAPRPTRAPRGRCAVR